MPHPPQEMRTDHSFEGYLSTTQSRGLILGASLHVCTLWRDSNLRFQFLRRASKRQEGSSVHSFPTLFLAVFTVALAVCTQGISAQSTQSTPTQTQSQPRSPGGDVGSGAGDIGK